MKQTLPKKPYQGRTMKRLASVQALFQLEQTGMLSSEVIQEFLTHRLKKGSKAECAFFAKLVEGSWETHHRSDEMIGGALKAGWTLERIEPVTRAILRAALYELLETQTPPAVIMNEYLNVTHHFFDDTEVSFVNGVLSTMAKKIRAEDFASLKEGSL